jgi:hypothetical protein
LGKILGAVKKIRSANIGNKSQTLIYGGFRHAVQEISLSEKLEVGPVYKLHKKKKLSKAAGRFDEKRGKKLSTKERPKKQ